jgi:cytochrome c-type biogenesis protein
MIEAPSVFLAFAAGFVSFVSPCCLPLVPGYLAAVTGTTPGQVPGGADRRRVLWRSLLFVSTFSAIFIVLGLSATLLGQLLFDNQQTLETVAGIVILAMGMLFVSATFLGRATRDWRPRWLTERASSRGGPALAGAAFAIAWTPCVGPTLGAILGFAAAQTGIGQGATLLTVYSAGLAIPFVMSAMAFTAGRQRLGWMRRHHATIQIASGALLITMGVLVLTGQLFWLNIEAQKLLARFGLNFFQSL